MKLRTHSLYALLPLGILLGTLIAGCAGQNSMPGRAFEGSLTQTIHLQGIGDLLKAGRDSARSHTPAADSSDDPEENHSSGGGMLGALAGTINMKMYVREDKVAYEMEALGGFLKMRSIIDRSTRTLTMILPTGQAIVTNLKAIDTLRAKVDDSLRAHQSSIDSLSAAMPQPTGKKQTINGFETEEYRGKMRGMDIVMWITTDPRMKFYDIIRDAFLGRNHTGMGGMEQIFDIIAPISGGKVPIKTEISQNGKVLMSSEISEIKEEKLDDKLFEIPKDYEIVKQDSFFNQRHHHHDSDSDDVPDKAPEKDSKE